MMSKRGEVIIYAMIECVDSSSWEVSSSSVGMRPAQEPYVYLSVSDLDQPPDGDLKIFNVPPPRRSRHRQPVEIGSHFRNRDLHECGQEEDERAGSGDEKAAPPQPYRYMEQGPERMTRGTLKYHSGVLSGAPRGIYEWPDEARTTWDTRIYRVNTCARSRDRRFCHDSSPIRNESSDAPVIGEESRIGRRIASL